MYIGAAWADEWLQEEGARTGQPAAQRDLATV